MSKADKAHPPLKGYFNLASATILVLAASVTFFLKLYHHSLVWAIGSFVGTLVSAGFIWLVLIVLSYPLKYLKCQPSKPVLFFIAAILVFLVRTSMAYWAYQEMHL